MTLRVCVAGGCGAEVERGIISDYCCVGELAALCHLGDVARA